VITDSIIGSTNEMLASYPVARTQDIDQAEAVLERILPRIPLQLRVATSGDGFDMQMNALDIGAVTASYLRFGSDIEVVNSETAFYHVNIPLSGRTVWRAKKFVVQSSPAVASVFGPGTVGKSLWTGGCAQLCVMLPQSSLDRELERHLDQDIAEPVSFAPAMNLTASTTRGWLDALQLVVREAERGGGRPLHPMITRPLEHLLVDSLLLAQRHNYTGELLRPSPLASPRAVAEAMALLRSEPEHPWTVGELAGRVHVSVRALQSAFARSVGVSPMRYLRQVRLSRVHAELLDANPETTTVTEVAARWGFIHHGHFAAGYRARFGEPPVHTLRR
jgi:AraC-like DNA-binding protein